MKIKVIPLGLIWHSFYTKTKAKKKRVSEMEYKRDEAIGARMVDCS